MTRRFARAFAISTGTAIVSGRAGNQNVFNPAGPAARDIAWLG